MKIIGKNMSTHIAYYVFLKRNCWVPLWRSTIVANPWAVRVCIDCTQTQKSKTKRTMKSGCRGDRMEMYKLQEPAWTNTHTHIPVHMHMPHSISFYLIYTAVSAAIFSFVDVVYFYRNFIRSHVCVCIAYINRSTFKFHKDVHFYSIWPHTLHCSICCVFFSSRRSKWEEANPIREE